MRTAEEARMELAKGNYSRRINQLRSYFTLPVAAKIMRIRIKKGLYPEIYNEFLKKEKKDKLNYRQARHRYNCNHKLRTEVFRKYQYKCARANCGSEQNLQIHHIIPIHRDHTLHSKIENLILLCLKCHQERHRNAP